MAPTRISPGFTGARTASSGSAHVALAGTRLEGLLARERLGPAAALAAAVALAWVWLAPMALDMYGPMTGAARWMAAPDWGLRYTLLVFLMWAVMMVGM